MSRRISRSLLAKRSLVLNCAVIFVLFCLTSARADQYTIRVNAQFSQFSTPTTQTFTGEDEVVTTLPLVSASQVSPSGGTSASATASPLEITAQFANANGGLSVARSNGTFIDNGLVFEDNAALRDLIGPTGTHLGILLNFDISYRLQTVETPGRFLQALSALDVNLQAGSVTGRISRSGEARILNSPFEHTFSNNGLLAGMPENGGDLRATLPIRITPFTTEGLFVKLTAFANISGLAFGADSFSNGTARIKIPELPFFVSTLDGTPAGDLGLEFNLVPRAADAPEPEPVPEPATMLLLGTGLASISALIRKRRKCRNNEEA